MTVTTRQQRDHYKMIEKQLESLNREQQSLRQTMAHLTHLYTPTTEKKTRSTSEQSFLKPNYLKMSHVELEDKLNQFNTMTATCLQQCDTSEKMDYLRYYLHLVCQITCLEYQEDLWKSYSTMSIIIFTRRMNLTTEFIEQNSLNPHLRTICSMVMKKPNLIRAQLNQQRERFYRCSQTFYRMKFTLTKTSFEQWLQRLVEHDLSPLRTFYAWKKKFFQAQVDDYCLVHSFFEHQPYFEQLRSARLIWQMTRHLLELKGQHALMERCLHYQQLTTRESTLISTFFLQLSWLPALSRYKEYRLTQSMKKAEMMMDQYRSMIRTVDSQLRQDIDENPYVSPTIQANQYIDLRCQSMRKITKLIIEWQLLAANYYQKTSL